MKKLILFVLLATFAATGYATSNPPAENDTAVDMVTISFQCSNDYRNPDTVIDISSPTGHCIQIRSRTEDYVSFQVPKNSVQYYEVYANTVGGEVTRVTGNNLFCELYEGQTYRQSYTASSDIAFTFDCN